MCRFLILKNLNLQITSFYMHIIHTFKVIFSFRTSKIMTTDLWRVYVNILKVYIFKS